MNKTNQNWYPYEDMGCFYKLEDGELLFCPMNMDGTIETTENLDTGEFEPNGSNVEWELVKDEPLAGVEGKTVGERLNEIVAELENKE